MGKIVISSSYKTRKHIAATHCTGFNIGDKQAVEKRFRGRLCKAKMAEKAQFTGVNEHFEAIFNAAEATQIVFQQPASDSPKGIFATRKKMKREHHVSRVLRDSRRREDDTIQRVMQAHTRRSIIERKIRQPAFCTIWTHSSVT